jgi:hypothetical protein
MCREILSAEQTGCALGDLISDVSATLLDVLSEETDSSLMRWKAA